MAAAAGGANAGGIHYHCLLKQQDSASIHGPLLAAANSSSYKTTLASPLPPTLPAFYEINTETADYADGGADYRYPSRYERWRMRLSAMCDSQTFADWNLERLYRKYAFSFDRALLSRFLLLYVILLLTLGALDFVANSYRPNERNVFHLACATVFLAVFVFLNCRLMRHDHLMPFSLLVLLLALVFSVLAFPIDWTARFAARDRVFTLADGLWECFFVVLSLYLLFPGRIYFIFVISLLISTAHSAVATVLVYRRHEKKLDIISPEIMNLFWPMLGANIAVLVAANVAGVFIQRLQEQGVRRAFLETKACIGHRLALQVESNKLNRLVACVVPETLTSDLRRDCLAGNFGWKVTAVAPLRAISIMSASIVGLTQLPGQQRASDVVRLLNELFSRFDQLTLDNNCYRLRIHGDVYVSLCGFPQPCADHARCCVELALGLCEVLNNVCESAEVGLDLRVGVHSGVGYGALIGKSRLTYDVTGEDVITAHQLQQMCALGKVLVSKSTFDALPDGYRAEQGCALEKLIPGRGVIRLETLYIKPRFSRNSISSTRQSQNSRRKLPRLQSFDAERREAALKVLTQAARYNAQVPFQFLADTHSTDLFKWNQAEDFLQNPLKRKGGESLSRGDKALHQYLSESLKTSGNPLDPHLNFNTITLRFKQSNRESEFHHQEDSSFGLAMVCALVLLLCSAGLQVAVLPRTIYLFLLFMIAFTWIIMMLLIILAKKFKCLEFNMQTSLGVRLAVILTSVIFVYSVAQVNVICCPSSLSRANYSLLPLLPNSDSSIVNCPLPAYIPLAAALSLLLVALFLALPALLKLILVTLISCTYILVMQVTHRDTFYNADQKWDAFSLNGLGRVQASQNIATVCVLVVALLVFVQGRFNEYVARLHFFWHTQAVDNQHEMFLIKDTSQNLLRNLLPQHVALHFTDNTTYRNPMDLYIQEFTLLGVLWARLPDWYPKTTETPPVVQDALRLLNDVICEFDELLKQDYYQDLCKVRSVTDNYIVAVGMNPLLDENSTSSSAHNLTKHVSLLLHFALAMKRKVEEVNAILYEDKIRLRVGVHLAPAFCGVLGGNQPVFDLWGEAPRVADLLQATAAIGHIQVSEKVQTATRAIFDYTEQGMLATGERETARIFYLKEVKGRAAPPPALQAAVQLTHNQQQQQQPFLFKQQKEAAAVGGGFDLNLSSPAATAATVVPPPRRTSLCFVADQRSFDNNSPKMSTSSAAPAAATVAESRSKVTILPQLSERHKQLTTSETQTPPMSNGCGRIVQANDMFSNKSRNIAPFYPPPPSLSAVTETTHHFSHQLNQQQLLDHQFNLKSSSSYSSQSAAIQSIQQQKNSITNTAATHFRQLQQQDDLAVVSEEHDEDFKRRQHALGHHNPLYTDNEYDSMVESNANLFVAMVPTSLQPVPSSPSPPPRPPRAHPPNVISHSYSNDHSDHLSALVLARLPPQHQHQSSHQSSQQQQQHQSAVASANCYTTSGGSPRASLTSNRSSSQRSGSSSGHRQRSRGDNNPRELPDYRRPYSPPNSSAKRRKAAQVNEYAMASVGAPFRYEGTLPLAADSDTYSYEPSSFGQMQLFRAYNGKKGDANGGERLPPAHQQSMLFHQSEDNMRISAVTPMSHLGGPADSVVSLVADSVYPSCDEFDRGNETDLDLIRLQSDIASELSDNVVSDLEDEPQFLAVQLSLMGGAAPIPIGGASPHRRMMSTPAEVAPFLSSNDNGIRQRDRLRSWQEDGFHSHSEQPLPVEIEALMSIQAPSSTENHRLPDMAPVLMPDFSAMDSSIIAEAGCSEDEELAVRPQLPPSKNIAVHEMLATSCQPEVTYETNHAFSTPTEPQIAESDEYERRGQTRREELALVKRRERFTKARNRRAGYSTDRSDRTDYDNDFDSDGGLSGYCCDVPSSAYESQVESELEEDYGYDNPVSVGGQNFLLRGGRTSDPSDYDNMDSDFSDQVREMLFRHGCSIDAQLEKENPYVESEFNEAIAAEARRISYVIANDFNFNANSNSAAISLTSISDLESCQKVVPSTAAELTSTTSGTPRATSRVTINAPPQSAVSIAADDAALTTSNNNLQPNGNAQSNVNERKFVVGDKMRQRILARRSLLVSSTTNGTATSFAASSLDRLGSKSLLQRSSSLECLTWSAEAGERTSRHGVAANASNATATLPSSAFHHSVATSNKKHVANEYHRLVSRAGRMRNILPSELQRFILPACISSSSLASSLYSSDPSLHWSAYESEYDNYRSDYPSPSDADADADEELLYTQATDLHLVRLEDDYYENAALSSSSALRVALTARSLRVAQYANRNT